jgi:hypothetical protein
MIGIKLYIKKTNSAKLVTSDMDIDAMYIEEYFVIKETQKAFIINDADIFYLIIMYTSIKLMLLFFLFNNICNLSKHTTYNLRYLLSNLKPSL